MYVDGVLLHLSQQLLQPFHLFIVLRRGVRRGVEDFGAGGNGDAPRIRVPHPASGLFDSGRTFEAALARSVPGIRLLERVEVGEILEGLYICTTNCRTLSVSKIGVSMALPRFWCLSR